MSFKEKNNVETTLFLQMTFKLAVCRKNKPLSSSKNIKMYPLRNQIKEKLTTDTDNRIIDHFYSLLLFLLFYLTAFNKKTNERYKWKSQIKNKKISRDKIQLI